MIEPTTENLDDRLTRSLGLVPIYLEHGELTSLSRTLEELKAVVAVEVTKGIREDLVGDFVLQQLMVALLVGDDGDAIGWALHLLDSFQTQSPAFRGNVVPRYRKAVVGIAAAQRSRSVSDLRRAADDLSQTWVGFPLSVYPTLFMMLARSMGIEASLEVFQSTSYSLWHAGLGRLAAGQLEDARALLEQSASLYRDSDYVGDACWLYTDLVICDLLRNDEEGAASNLASQEAYFHERLVANPHTPPQHLLKYVTSSRYFVRSLSKNRESMADILAGIDVFTFGWRTYPLTPYVTIFARLREHASERRTDGLIENPHRSAYQLWKDALETALIEHDSRNYDELLRESAVRLRYANMAS